MALKSTTKAITEIGMHIIAFPIYASIYIHTNKSQYNCSNIYIQFGKGQAEFRLEDGVFY